MVPVWSDVFRTRTRNWTFVSLTADRAPDDCEHRALDPDIWYLSAFLRCMRIVNVRKGLTKFYGAIHSSMALGHYNDGVARFQTITTPDQLKDQDAKHLDRIISFNHRLLGPVPYRGGDVDVELGLFSVKAADLAAPYLKLLENLAAAGGVSFVAAAKPFFGPIKDGIDLLTGGAAKTILEVGLATTFSPAKTGHFVVIRAPKGSIDEASLFLDENYRLQTTNGDSLEDHPYLVFSFEAHDRRDDWYCIPEIKTKYEKVRFWARQRQDEMAADALEDFRRTVLLSPDLLTAHAERLYGQAEANMHAVIEKRSQDPGSSAAMRDLSAFNLF